MLNVAVISAWHVHAEGYAQFVAEQPDSRLVAVWDDDKERGEKFAKQFGIDYESDIDRMLARTDIDAVLCTSPTSEHVNLLVKAANAKKHIYTEKALAATVEGCEEIAKAVRENGVKFVISFPQRTYPSLLFLKQMIDSGKLGKITYLRYRDAHGGSCQNWLPDYWYDAEKTCGGAMMDLGCHPNYVASFLLGKPVRVNSMFNTVCCPDTMEDNAVSVVEFENKAIAVLETGFVSPWSSPEVELYGTEGSVIVEPGTRKVRYRLKDMEGWMSPDQLPEALPMALRQFIDACLYDKPVFFDMDAAIKLTELLENEYIAANEGRTVTIK